LRAWAPETEKQKILNLSTSLNWEPINPPPPGGFSYGPVGYSHLEPDMHPFVPFTSDDEILEIGYGLMDRTLPKAAWTHAAHFAAVIWLLAKDTRRPLFVTCNELMASPLGRSEWLLTYWSRPRLFSVEARRAWLDPDIQTLPFPSSSKKP